MPIAVCVALASTFAVANNDFPNYINDNHTVSNSGGFDGVSNDTYNFNNIEVTIGAAENIWQGGGLEGLTGKTTTAFNVWKSTLNAYGEIKIINNASHENIGNNNALYAQSNSAVTIDAEKVFIASLPSYKKNSFLLPQKDAAITASDNSSISIAGEIVQIIGSVDIKDSASHVSLDISGPDSYWLGSSSYYPNNLNVKLSDNATWIYDREKTLSSSSKISNLDLSGGRIVLNEEEIQKFISPIEFSDGVNDCLHVPDFYIKNNNNKDVNQHSAVTIENNNADELFAFTYATDSEFSEEDDLTYWYLTKETGRTNENVDFLESVPLVTYALATDLDRLHDRMNEAVLDDHKNGLWARYRFSKTGFDQAFETDAHMIQVGYNHNVSTADSRKFVGLAFDYTSADTDLDGLSGNGDSERYALSVYYTVLANCGGYADIVGKIGRVGSDYDLRNNLGAAIGSSFWQTYYGISAEFGWKYQATKSFFFEPQTQLQVMRIEGDNFTTKGGVRAEIYDINSIIGRLGFRTGFTYSFADALPASSVYLLADVLHEFNGDNAFRATGRTTAYEDSHTGSQTWYDVGIGTNLSLSEKAKVLMNAKYVAGGDFESSWVLNADLRYEF